MLIHTVTADTPLAKSYRKIAGVLHKDSYPNVKNMTSTEHKVNNIADLFDVINKTAAANGALIKGALTRQLNNESRAGATNREANTQWVCMDIDGLPGVNAEQFMALAGLSGVSHIIQYSASHLVDGNTDLRCHIFMLLDKPTPARLLKQWLVQLNHTLAPLTAAIKLTRTATGLRWPLDVTTCQNDKIIYVAPPKFIGMAAPKIKERVILNKRALATLSLPPTIATEDENRARTNERINALRAAEGLPSHKLKTKQIGTIDLMQNVSGATITSMKTERGFVYFNLNGGDSWAYYHPADNPKYIHSFKDEFSFLTKELLPEYWEQLHDKGYTTTDDGLTHLCFRDRRTSGYWAGTHNTKTGEVELFAVKNDTQVRDYAEQYGVLLGTYIPTWDMIFDPHSDIRVDYDNMIINTFCPSEYMLRPKPRTQPPVPPVCMKVIRHVVGNDEETAQKLLDWVAYIMQERTRTQTAWILHGTQGTGKGTLVNEILRPLFGPQQTSFRMAHELSEPYNEYVARSLLVFVDEFQADALTDEKVVTAKLKTYFVEPRIPIRVMHRMPYEADNRSNWIFSSNVNKPVVVSRNDRRYNVAPRQEVMLEISAEEYARISTELGQLADHLHMRKVAFEDISRPTNTQARMDIMDVSETSLEATARAVIEGDFSFFLLQLPDSPADTLGMNALRAQQIRAYTETLTTLATRAAAKDGLCNISRDELHSLFSYVVGNIPDSPNKFTSLIKHYGLTTKPVRTEARTLKLGLQTKFRDLTPDTLPDVLAATKRSAATPQPPAPVQLKVHKGNRR